MSIRRADYCDSLFIYGRVRFDYTVWKNCIPYHHCMDDMVSVSPLHSSWYIIASNEESQWLTGRMHSSNKIPSARLNFQKFLIYYYSYFCFLNGKICSNMTFVNKFFGEFPIFYWTFQKFPFFYFTIYKSIKKPPIFNESFHDRYQHHHSKPTKTTPPTPKHHHPSALDPDTFIISRRRGT